MAAWFGAFRVWFQAQTLTVKRQAIVERLDVLFTDPLVDDVMGACPPSVRFAFENFKLAVRQTDWTVRQ